MKGFSELSVAALTLLGAVYAEDAEAPSDVHVLTTDTFDAFIEANPLALAEFYAPWCGHCKALAPEYEDAATKLKEKEIPLAKVDCTVETDLCQSYGVQGYPTVKVFRGKDTEPSSYTGQRKSDAIVSYMIKQAMPAVSILDKETIEEFKTADNVVLVAFHEASDKTTNATFTEVAEKLRDNFLFGATSDSALAKEAGVKAPAIVLYKNFDNEKDIFDGKFTAEEITSFAKVASTPLVGEVGPDTYTSYMDAGIPLAYIFVDKDEDKEKLTATVKPIAEKYKGKVNFATIDASAFGAHAQNLNLEQKWPAFAIQDTTKNLKYPFDQEKEITEKEINAFVKSYVDGKLKPSIKSEPTPETQEGPVHVVVANNYEEIVMDNDKDVLLEFYAPWCGHCKNLAPKYEELASFYFNNPEFAKKVVVAKVDATNNDVPVDISGFPTIKLYPAGKKDEPVDYSGARTVEDLAEFIKENGKYHVDAYVAPEPAAEAGETLGEAAAAASKAAEKATDKVKEAAASAVADDNEKDHDEL